MTFPWPPVRGTPSDLRVFLYIQLTAVRRGFQILDACPFGHADLEVIGRLVTAEIMVASAEELLEKPSGARCLVPGRCRSGAGRLTTWLAVTVIADGHGHGPPEHGRCRRGAAGSIPRSAQRGFPRRH